MEKQYLKLFVFGLLTSSMILLPNPIFASTHCDFPAIFNFGDSNSDTGGYSAAFGQAYPPAGESFFHGPAGRYSDGRLVIDFIAESLELPYVHAFLDAVGSNFSHGANFATAASAIRHQNTSGSNPFPLNVQSYQFHDFQKRSHVFRSKGGIFRELLPKADYFSRALYTFDIGQNDMTAVLNLPMDQLKAYIPDVLDQFKTIIMNIYDLGGRSFWIHNTGPLGCLPYIFDNMPVTAAQVDRVGCAIPFNQVAKFFNRRLKEAVIQLRKKLPLAAITYVDIYSVKYSLFSQAKKLGFEYPFLVCCGHGGKYNYNVHHGCGEKIMVDGKEVIVGSCKDPSVRISWDGAHFTQAANKFVFDQIVSGKHSDPPIPLKMACHRKQMH